MTNQSLVETVNAFIEDINACNSDAEIDALLASRDLRVHGLHTRYNSLQDVEKADKLIDEAAQNRRAVLPQGGASVDDLQEGDTVEVTDSEGHCFAKGFRYTFLGEDMNATSTLEFPACKIADAYGFYQFLRRHQFKKVN